MAKTKHSKREIEKASNLKNGLLEYDGKCYLMHNHKVITIKNVAGEKIYEFDGELTEHTGSVPSSHYVLEKNGIYYDFAMDYVNDNGFDLQGQYPKFKLAPNVLRFEYDKHGNLVYEGKKYKSAEVYAKDFAIATDIYNQLYVLDFEGTTKMIFLPYYVRDDARRSYVNKNLVFFESDAYDLFNSSDPIFTLIKKGDDNYWWFCKEKKPEEKSIRLKCDNFNVARFCDYLKATELNGHLLVEEAGDLLSIVSPSGMFVRVENAKIKNVEKVGNFFVIKHNDNKTTICSSFTNEGQHTMTTKTFDGEITLTRDVYLKEMKEGYNYIIGTQTKFLAQSPTFDIPTIRHETIAKRDNATTRLQELANYDYIIEYTDELGNIQTRFINNATLALEEAIDSTENHVLYSPYVNFKLLPQMGEMLCKMDEEGNIVSKSKLGEKEHERYCIALNEFSQGNSSSEGLVGNISIDLSCDKRFISLIKHMTIKDCKARINACHERIANGGDVEVEFQNLENIKRRYESFKRQLVIAQNEKREREQRIIEEQEREKKKETERSLRIKEYREEQSKLFCELTDEEREAE